MEMIKKPDGKVIACRWKRVRLTPTSEITQVLEPVMVFETQQAATIWVEGQEEIQKWGEWAGFDHNPEDAPCMDNHDPDRHHL